MSDVPSGVAAAGRHPGAGRPAAGPALAQPAHHRDLVTARGDRRCVAAGLGSIGVWREPVAEVGLATASAWLSDAGLRVSSLCRGGFFTAADERARKAAHEENLRAIDEAAELGAATLVLVPGGLPDGDRDLAGARARVAEAMAGLAPYAARARRPARHRADAPDLRRRPRRRLDPGPGARHRRAVPRRRRSASSSTPSTCGGSRACSSRSPAPETGSRRTRSATGSPRCRPTPCSPAAWSATATSTSPRSPGGGRNRLRRRRRGRDLQRRRLGRARRRGGRHHGPALRRARGAVSDLT